MRVAMVLMLCGCARAATSVPEPTTTTGVEDEVETPSSEIVWHTVDDLGEGDRYVILGRVEVPAGEGRLLDGGEVDMYLHEVGGEVPTLTLVGHGATCVPASARRVVIVRDMDPEGDYRDAFSAIAVQSECEPVLAVEDEHLDARLVALEISEPPFGEPILASGEAWTARFEYGPSEDEICPGFPLHVEVRRDDEVLLARDFELMLSHVRIAMLGERAWIVLGALEEERMIELGSDDAEQRFTWPSGIDAAQTCI